MGTLSLVFFRFVQRSTPLASNYWIFACSRALLALITLMMLECRTWKFLITELKAIILYKKWLIIMNFKSFIILCVCLFIWHWMSTVNLRLTHLTLAGQLANSLLNCQISWRIVSIYFDSAVGACGLRVTQSIEMAFKNLNVNIWPSLRLLTCYQREDEWNKLHTSNVP
jgi:hypothetical protein